MDKLLYRPTELIDLLGCSRSKIYALISQGDLPHIKVGPRGIRVPVDGVRKWIARKSGDIDSDNTIEE